MKPEEPSRSDAFKFLTLCWNGIPRRSWRNRNAAMHSALGTAVSSGMDFSPEDMQLVGSKFNASYWTGDGEGFYTLACETKNIPAAIAFEKWLVRPAYMWAEKTKVAERLFVGAKFSWDGHIVTVTSMNRERLIACTYKAERYEKESPAVGQTTDAFGSSRMIEAYSVTSGGAVMVRVGPPIPDKSSSIERRFSVTFDELLAARKQYDKRRREYIDALTAAVTLDDLATIEVRYVNAGRRAFRHFDIEEINAAYKFARERITEAMSATERDAHQRKVDAQTAADLDRWIAGEQVPRRFDVVRLRVRGDYVETSTGQSATVQGVRLALAFIKKHRRQGWSSNGSTFDLDQYPMREINPKGVQVGCTFVPWSEVDRIESLL